MKKWRAPGIDEMRVEMAMSAGCVDRESEYMYEAR